MPYPCRPHRVGWIGRLLGFDANFTMEDKWIAGTLASWTFLLLGVLVVGTAWNLIAPWPLAVWSRFWEVMGIGIPILIAVVTGLWFTWGGIRDMVQLFGRLRSEHVDHQDDGSVMGPRESSQRVHAVAGRNFA